MPRKLILILLTAAVMISLCGCSSFIDVRLRLVVHAVGIDPAEDGTYEVSWQVFKAQPPEGGGPVDATGQNVITIVTYGRSIYEAQKSLERQTGKEVFTGDMELIVLGSDFAGKDISRLMSYFWDDCDIYMGINVALAEGKASEITGVTLEHGTAVTELLNEMIKATGEESRTVPARLIDISNRLNDDKEDFVMPVLTAKKADYSNGEKDTTIYDKAVGVFKTALVSDGKPSGYLTTEETMGICLLTAKAENVTMLIPENDCLVITEARITKVKRRASIGSNGFPLIKIAISGELMIKDDPDRRGHRDIKERSQDELFRLCELAYQRTAAADGTDVLDVARPLRKYENKYYSENKSNLDAIVQNTDFEVTIDLKQYTDDTDRT